MHSGASLQQQLPTSFSCSPTCTNNHLICLHLHQTHTQFNQSLYKPPLIKAFPALKNLQFSDQQQLSHPIKSVKFFFSSFSQSKMKSSDGATVINVPAEKGTTSTSSVSKAKVIASTPKAVIATTTATKHGKRWKKGIALLDFLLRIVAIATALAATVTMGTTDQTLPFFTQYFQFHASYNDLPSLLFFVVANAIVTGYLVLSLPFSIITIIRSHLVGARLLLLILDTVMVALTSAGAAAAAAIVYLAHTGNDKANWVAICQQFDEFCQQTSGAVVASFVTAAILMLLVIMAAFALRKH